MIGQQWPMTSRETCISVRVFLSSARNTGGRAAQPLVLTAPELPFREGIFGDSAVFEMTHYNRSKPEDGRSRR